jgi:hypothetical protein
MIVGEAVIWTVTWCRSIPIFQRKIWSPEFHRHVKSQTFWRNISSPFSGFRSRPSKSPGCHLLLSGFLLGLLCSPKDGENMFL